MRSTSKNYDPSWFKMSFLLHLLAVVLGIVAGNYVYMYELKPYYAFNQLQTYPHLDVPLGWRDLTSPVADLSASALF